MKGRNRGSRENIKGTIAKEENKKSRWKTKGTGSAKEEIKCMTGKLKGEGGNKG